MIELPGKFYTNYPIDPLEKATDFLNYLEWNLSIYSENGTYTLNGGDQAICRTNNIEELNSFISGMAFGLSMLPVEVIEEIKRIISE